MVNLIALHAVVYGRVQGVFFRAFVADQAAGLGLTGYVRNLSTGEAVEVRAEGDKAKLEQFLALLQIGPPRAVVKKVTADWLEYMGSYSDFHIEHN
jgi:acylphosphatase